MNMNRPRVKRFDVSVPPRRILGTSMADPATTTNGNTELIEFLQGHFTKVDRHFAEVGRRFTEVQEEFREKFEKVNERIDGLYTLIDSFVKLHQKLDIELTALRDKYNRLARAHNELAVRVARIEGTPA